MLYICACTLICTRSSITICPQRCERCKFPSIIFLAMNGPPQLLSLGWSSILTASPRRIEIRIGCFAWLPRLDTLRVVNCAFTSRASSYHCAQETWSFSGPPRLRTSISTVKVCELHLSSIRTRSSMSFRRLRIIGDQISIDCMYYYNSQYTSLTLNLLAS